MTGPDVTVVLISYNDVERLPRAIRSLQRQTLRSLEIVVVDDASTDGTADVVQALAAADPRIRYERLGQNSGGCSAPRNRGLHLARGTWVMFCDSDDEYERHACKNLLQAAERLDADLVCGTAERVDVATGRRRRWRPEVHDTTRVEAGLESFPELVYDTISVNKIYRRTMLEDAGIAFPEGLLFEDQLFTMEAFAAAGRLAAIPETVYLWYVDRLSDEPSITQRRNEVRNVDSRIEVNRRIDAFLAERGLASIQRIKDLKFLRHDLYLYLSSILEADDDTALELMERLRPYVASVSLAPAWDVRPALRVAIYHLLVGDLAGVRAAMRTVKWASVVGAPIVRDGAHERWACEHLLVGPPVAGFAVRDWLDVTGLHPLAVPFTQRRYLHVLDALTVDDGVVTASGSTVDFDGSLGTVEAVELRVLLAGDRTVMTVPAQWTSTTGPTWRWRAHGRPAAGLPRPLEPKDRGTLGLALRRGEHVNVVSVRASQLAVPEAEVPFTGSVRAGGPGTCVLEPYENGAVGWRAGGPVAGGAWSAGWSRVPGLRRLERLIDEFMPGVVQRIGALLPARRLAVFESVGGRVVSGEPRAISARLHELHPEIRQAWVRRSALEDVPPYAEPVERYSLRHQWLLVQARYWIDDGTSPLTVRRPGRARAVLTGSGVPITRMGLDDPSVLVDGSATRDVRRRAARTTLALAVAPSDVARIRSGRAFAGEVVVTGLARADEARALRTSGPTALRGLRRTLDLPEDRSVVLYAPARRAQDPDDIDRLLDLPGWCEVLGERTYLLLNPEAPARFDVPARLRYAVRDVGSERDLGRLLAACDLVVSDYSSVIGDAALLDLPIVLYQPDHEVYVNRTHGLYPWPGSPGPQVRDESALLAEVAAFADDPLAWDARHREARREFASGRCGSADASAATRAVAAIMGRTPPDAGDGGRP